MVAALQVSAVPAAGRGRRPTDPPLAATLEVKPGLQGDVYLSNPPKAAPAPADAKTRVATALVKGLEHAPAGVWHSVRDMGKAVVDHPVLTGAILAGSLAVTVAVPAAAPVLVWLGGAAAAGGVGLRLYQAASTAVGAKDQNDLDLAARQAGDAYGDAIVNGALFALPYVAGRAASARAKSYMQRAIAEADAQVPAPTPPVDFKAQAMHFVENAMKTPPAELMDDAARTMKAVPRAKRKELITLMADDAFATATPETKAAMLLDKLGPGFTKLAQVYSEADGVPPAVAKALRVSRDAMRPMPEETLHQLLSNAGEQRMGDVIRGIYTIGKDRYKLDKLLGVASVGEVHLATDVSTGAKVVIKIRKPGASPELIKQEFKMMREMLEVGAKHAKLSEAQRTIARESLKSFQKGVLEEIDMTREARNAERFLTQYADAGFDGVKVHHVSKKGDLLVMDVAEGVPFTKLDTLPAAERQEAMLSYLRGMLRQVFDGYFHADPHPGNVFWNSAKRRIQFIDMGAMGETTPTQQLELAEMLLTMLSRDPKAIAKMMIRTADRITSPLPRPQLEAQLADEIGTFLGRYTRGGDLNKQTMDLMKTSQRLGVWPKDNGFWFNKTMFTVVTTVDKPTQQLFMAEALPQIGKTLAKMAVTEPAHAKQVLVRVATAARRNPQEFVDSLIVQSRANPSMLGGLPKWAVRASNEMVLPARLLTLDVRQSD